MRYLIQQMVILLAVVIALFACESGSRTAPQRSLGFDCFNPSATSLECTATVIAVNPVEDFQWQATGQEGQNGRGTVTAAWDYLRFCNLATTPRDVTVRLAVFLENGDQLGPISKLYQVCLDSSSSAASTAGVECQHHR